MEFADYVLLFPLFSLFLDPGCVFYRADNISCIIISRCSNIQKEDFGSFQEQIEVAVGFT